MLLQDELNVWEAVLGSVMSGIDATVHSEKSYRLSFSGWSTCSTVRWRRKTRFSEDHREQRSSPNWAPCPRSPWHTGRWFGHWRIYHSWRCYGSPSWSILWGSVSAQGEEEEEGSHWKITQKWTDSWEKIFKGAALHRTTYSHTV